MLCSEEDLCKVQGTDGMLTNGLALMRSDDPWEIRSRELLILLDDMHRAG